MWVEEAGAGRKDLSAHHVRQILYEVFEEAKILATENRRVGLDTDMRVFSYEERCLATGALALLDRSALDTSGCPGGARPNQQPQWEGGPQKRLRLAQESLSELPAGRVARAVRDFDHLSREATLRCQCHSIATSWKGYASAIRAWGLYMDVYHPDSKHYPLHKDLVGPFALHFQNRGTFKRT